MCVWIGCGGVGVGGWGWEGGWGNGKDENENVYYQEGYTFGVMWVKWN